MFSNDCVYTSKMHVRVVDNTSFLFTFDHKFQESVVTGINNHMQKGFSEIEKKISDKEAPNQEGGDQQNLQVCSKSVCIVVDCLSLHISHIVTACHTLVA